MLIEQICIHCPNIWIMVSILCQKFRSAILIRIDPQNILPSIEYILCRISPLWAPIHTDRQNIRQYMVGKCDHWRNRWLPIHILYVSIRVNMIDILYLLSRIHSNDRVLLILIVMNCIREAEYILYLRLAWQNSLCM